MCKIFFVKDKEEAEKLAKEDDIMEKAVNKLCELSENELLLGLYNAEKVDKKVQNTIKLSARLEGLEEGKKEDIKEAAKNFLKNNVNIDIIIKSTGLTKEEIEELK